MSVPRPKSSPSTFGPNVEDLLFPENPFRIKQDLDYATPMFNMSPVPSSKAPSPYFPGDYAVSNPSISPARPAPIPIAPDPVGLRQMNALKRMREEEDYAEFTQKRRKRAPSQVGPVELNEEEQLLLKLKEEENLPWKDIATRFQTELGRSYQVPALQMRFKRLRERMRTWTDTDVGNSLFFFFIGCSHLGCWLMLRQVQALEQAYEYWEKFQFDIIAAKVRRLRMGHGCEPVWFLTQACPADVGIRSVRTMAGQILCPEMGGAPSWTNTFSTPHQPFAGPLGRGTLQSGRILDV